MKKIISISTLLVSALGFSTFAQADDIDDIKAKGKLVVAVKADYKPYGYRNDNGEIVGLEIDLAQDVAQRLGVALELVPAQSSNRMEFLVDGKVDLLIATMSDKPSRREIVYIADQAYYSSGSNIIAKRSSQYSSWGDLKGQKVCGIKGAFYNEATEATFGATIVPFGDSEQSLDALRQGKCDAFVYDDSFIAGKLKDAQWAQDYEMPLPTINDNPWGLAVRLGEDRFHSFMNETIIDWHKTGFILNLETKHGLKNTPFALGMNGLYQ